MVLPRGHVQGRSARRTWDVADGKAECVHRANPQAHASHPCRIHCLIVSVSKGDEQLPIIQVRRSGPVGSKLDPGMVSAVDALAGQNPPLSLSTHGPVVACSGLPCCR